MDALVMSGTGLQAGAVAAIKNVKNPVKVARLVMEKTPHVMLAGQREKIELRYGNNKEYQRKCMILIRSIRYQLMMQRENETQ